MSMQMTKERRPAIRTIEGWAISVLLEAGAVRECEEHGWMKHRGDGSITAALIASVPLSLINQ